MTVARARRASNDLEGFRNPLSIFRGDTSSKYKIWLELFPVLRPSATSRPSILTNLSPLPDKAQYPQPVHRPLPIPDSPTFTLTGSALKRKGVGRSDNKRGAPEHLCRGSSSRGWDRAYVADNRGVDHIRSYYPHFAGANFLQHNIGKDKEGTASDGR